MISSSNRSSLFFRFMGVAALLFLAPGAFGSDDLADKAMAGIRAESVRADMAFLSDDLLEGRFPGTRGYSLAAKFMATEFAGIGLEPAGDQGSFYQQVPFRSMRVDASNSSVTLIRNGKTEALAFAEDYILRPDPGRNDVSVEAPVVFVGFGVTAPGQNYDDYKGVDAKGKIVAIVYGAPHFEPAIRAHYSSSEMKLQNAAAHGAVGVITIDDPVLEKSYPFSKFVRDLVNPNLRWLDKNGRPNDYFPELKGGAFLSLPAAKKFFAGSGHSDEEIFAAAKAGKLFSFPLPFAAKLHTVTHSENIHSPNIVARLEGSDPVLKNEFVVYTAHLDHLGIGQPVDGDKIYNGALDNASGCATILEIARAFSQMNPRPKRSILFVAVTGEEEGLLGSDYFAHYPAVPEDSIVANVNVDEVAMLWPLRDVIAFGAEHSSLGEVVKAAADRMHLTVSPDPLPEEVVFIRSDQYSFVKQGIPAVMPSPGLTSGDPKIDPFKIFMGWEETRYHQPQDDMAQPGLDFNAGAEFARFAFLCGYLVAENPQRPTWNKNDFFGDHYARKP